MSLGEALLIAASLVTMPAALKRPSPRLYRNGGPCPRTRHSLALMARPGGRSRAALRALTPRWLLTHPPPLSRASLLMFSSMHIPY